MKKNEISIFEKIIKKEIFAHIIFEDDFLIVIKDINPQAPIHYLIIPKEKFQNVNDIPSSKINIIEKMFLAAQFLSKNDEAASEYKLIINNGASAGQNIFHLHMHFLAGYNKLSV